MPAARPPPPACLHPQNAATGRWEVLVSRCGVPGDLRPASPLPPAGPRHPSLCQGLGEQWGKAKVTWAPGTCNRLVARATAFLTEQMRTREGERLAQGHPPPRPQAMPGGNGTRPSGPGGPWVLFSPRTSSWEQRGLGELESPPQRFRQGPARCLSFPGPRSAVVTSQVAARPRLPDRRFPGTVMLLVSREFWGAGGHSWVCQGEAGPLDQCSALAQASDRGQTLPDLAATLTGSETQAGRTRPGRWCPRVATC